MVLGIVNLPAFAGKAPLKIPTGLKNATNALKALFEGGTIRGKTIIEIRDILLRGGFTQGVTENGEVIYSEIPLVKR
jgi:hypothetical protein